MLVEGEPPVLDVVRDLAAEQRESARSLCKRARAARESSVRLRVRRAAPSPEPTFDENTARVFHDLKSPLAAMTMWLHILRTSEPEGIQPALAALEDSVLALQRQIAAICGSRAEETAAASVPDDLDLGQLRVLVVDDNDHGRDALAAVLERYGCHVATAASGVEALECLSFARPEVIVSDISMPEMDGYEFIRELRARDGAYSATPAIALTGGGDEHGCERALASGFQAYFAKPAPVAALLTHIAKLGGRSE